MTPQFPLNSIGTPRDVNHLNRRLHDLFGALYSPCVPPAALHGSARPSRAWSLHCRARHPCCRRPQAQVQHSRKSASSDLSVSFMRFAQMMRLFDGRRVGALANPVVSTLCLNFVIEPFVSGCCLQNGRIRHGPSLRRRGGWDGTKCKFRAVVSACAS